MMPIRVCALVAFVVIAACAPRDENARPRVRLAIGGQNQMVYLPTTLARELGFYEEEGLDVELQDFAGGSKALQALIGGSSDVVSGFYDHTIQMAAEGRQLVAFVAMLRFPGLVLVTSPQAAASVKTIADLKGRIVGVTTAGSSSQMLVTYFCSGITCLWSRSASPPSAAPPRRLRQSSGAKWTRGWWPIRRLR
jgi:NitT/TauT family transport system substrate-binding protein